MNYFKLLDFDKDKLPQEDRAQLQALIDEGRLIARTFLQAAVDAADMALRSMVMATVMGCESWLHSLRFLREVQNMIEDMPFDETNLFSEKNIQVFTFTQRLHGNSLLPGYVYTPTPKGGIPQAQAIATALLSPAVS